MILILHPESGRGSDLNLSHSVMFADFKRKMFFVLWAKINIHALTKNKFVKRLKLSGLLYGQNWRLPKSENSKLKSAVVFRARARVKFRIRIIVRVKTIFWIRDSYIKLQPMPQLIRPCWSPTKSWHIDFLLFLVVHMQINGVYHYC